MKNPTSRNHHSMIALLLLFFSCGLFAQQQDPIKLGMSAALSGPTKYLGLSMQRGMDEYFSLVNSQQDGVNGREIELIIMDDKYDPDTAVTNTRHLIEHEGAIAIVGNVGTPTANAVSSVVREGKVVFFAPLTGANSLRDDVGDEYVFNYRASYLQEMRVIVKHIEQSLISPRRIAFLLQDDGSAGYGNEGFEAAREILTDMGFQKLDELTVAKYLPNSLETDAAITKIIHSDYEPQAIIIVGTAQPSAHFIRFMHSYLPRANFYNLSFAGAGSLASALPEISGRVFMTQVVPMLEDSLPKDLVEREGYLAARLLVDVMKTIEGEIDAASLQSALNGYGVERPPATEDRAKGPPLTLNADDKQASDFVEITVLKGGAWESLSPRVDDSLKGAGDE